MDSVSHQLYQPDPVVGLLRDERPPPLTSCPRSPMPSFFLGHASFSHFHTCAPPVNRRTQSSFRRPPWRPRTSRPRWRRNRKRVSAASHQALKCSLVSFKCWDKTPPHISLNAPLSLRLPCLTFPSLSDIHDSQSAMGDHQLARADE